MVVKVKREKFERVVEIIPAFDKRHEDPKENYGIHGCDLRMILKGRKGATQFVVFTNWHLPHVQKEFDAKRDFGMVSSHTLCHPMPADVGYHSYTPRYEGQNFTREDCAYLGGKRCYSDGSGLDAYDVYKMLVEKGGEAVWSELERRYHQWFPEKVKAKREGKT